MAGDDRAGAVETLSAKVAAAGSCTVPSGTACSDVELTARWRRFGTVSAAVAEVVLGG